MAVDTPATIAIVGAGPIGLEAALYARFLGYDLKVFEQDRVATYVRHWGHVRMFSPFRMNCSRLGLAALHAQDASYRPPVPEALLTGREWAQQYLIPLAQTDLLDGSVYPGCRVVSIGRPDSRKSDLALDGDRADQSFRLLVVDQEGEERIETADAVIDASGVYGQANWCGRGGIPAPGERDLNGQIEYQLPDVLGTAREHYADRHTLVIGSGHSAATTVAALAELAKHRATTRVTWLTRAPASDKGPVPIEDDDSFVERKARAEAANRLALRGAPTVTWIAGKSLEAIRHDPTEHVFHVWLQDVAEPGRFDRIVAQVGYRPDLSLLEELQISACPLHEAVSCHATECGNRTAPLKAADHHSTPESLILPEPDIYVLGAKSRGRGSRFVFAAGLEQIRQLFSIIGDRADLDLYATAHKLPG